ncbi:MAG: NPCBM/NEW2 domain-containing protein [Paraclostridium sordellii]
MKKKIVSILAMSMIATNSIPVVNVFANEVVKDKAVAIEKSVSKNMTVTDFKIKNNPNFNKYNELYKVGVKSITNNGGNYPNASLTKAIDGNLSTHWETGKPNSETFKNEITFEFDDIAQINRLAYATRQDGAKGKGYPASADIYVSKEDKGDNFELAGEVKGSKVTGGIVEFKFDTVSAKRVKFVFKEANQNWASASEFWFYKEDKTLEKMSRLFKDSNMNVVSDEFNSLDKLKVLEAEAKAHPFYSDFQESLDNARMILEGNDVTYVDAKVSKFKAMGTKGLEEYDNLYKIANSHIKKITTNGGHWSNNNIENAIDGNPDTYWHSNSRNSSTHTNEVIMTLDELQNLDKIVYTSPRDRGFAEAFDIYTSKTTEGDTFTKVTSGTATRTRDSIAIKFNPTKAKRVKFVFKKGYEDWALASEFGLYKEDTTLDKIARLFTNSNMNSLSEEFNSLDKLKYLEDECIKHPFYNDFKEDLENAKALVEQGNLEVSSATTKKFNYLENTEYIKQFRIPYSDIKKISNNAGNYAAQNIEKAIDNDISTYWETNKSNNENWNNEITVEFVNPVTIDKIAYGARQSDTKGFIEEFEIYGSNTSKGDTFQLVSTGKASRDKGLVEAKFKPTKFKRIKLKVVKSNQNWATLNEIMFFKQDDVSDKVEKLFKNGLMTELNEEFNSLEVIEALEKQVKVHPLKSDLIDYIELAKNILKGETSKETSRTLVAEQRGNYSKEGAKRSINGSAYTSFEPFGRYVTPGEEITVYVDADPNGAMPKLCFGQVGKSEGDWRKWVTLHPGKNIIKAPTNMNCAGVYLVNDYYAKEQAYAPKVRFEGGQAYPVYRHGETNPQEFVKQLEDYASKVEYSDEAFKNGNPKGKVFNIAELVSKNCVITTSAKGALEGVKWANTKGYNVADTMDGWEEMYNMFQSFMGFEENAVQEKDSKFPNKFVARVFQGVPLGYADHGYTGYLGSSNAERDGGFFKLIVAPPQMPGNDNWAYNHEFGHIFNTKHIVHGEVTNNLYAQEYRRLHPGVGGDRANWNEILKRFKGEEFKLSHFENLAILSQLNIAYGYDAYTKASKAVRDHNDVISSIQGGELRRLAVAYSLGLGVDLLDFFEGWKYTDVTPQMREAVKGLPKPDKKIEYLHGGAYDYKGNGFSEDVKVTISSTLNKAERTNTLKFGIDNNNRDDLLGYEILKNGEVIGYTKDNSFVVKNINLTENVKYDVVAYAKNLSTAKAVSINSFQPRMKVVDGVTLGLHEKFNPLDYVKATDYEGNKLSDIKVTSNVDNNKKGNYTVTYEVKANDVVTTKTMNVDVVSKYDYLSDKEWKSIETQWGTPRRNKDIKGRTLGEPKNYEKGIGIHANGNVVYDLGEHNYDNFEVKVGVDMNIAPQNNSSISFKVIGDGKTLATTKVLKHEDDLQYIKVPVKGVKELKIEVNNGGNGNTSDHGIIVEPKLTSNNAKPTLEIPKSQSVKVGETLENVVGNYKAIDSEDGDLTSKVVVTGQDKINFNRVGKYQLTYSVMDSDGNKVEKTRVISVVNMEDFKYLSDYDWKSAQTSWSSVKKDKAVSDNKLRLTDENGKEVVYEKGIGTHANSTIVYNLEGKNADFFSSYVGVDRAMYGTVGSVQFEVYLDGDKAFDSGVMNSKDTQKYVELNVAGVKELKLVVKDGGNGIGSDHATWGDAKLHYVNADRVDNKELLKTIEEAKKINKENYTEDSFKALNDKLTKAEELSKDKNAKQDAIDNMTKELQDSIKALVLINLNEVVNVPDKYLVKSLSSALGKTGNFTIGDMRKLTNLNISHGVNSLEGLQYAINLESINGEGNQVKDLRVLSKLDKLKSVNFKNQYVEVGELYPINGKIKVNTETYNREGKNISTKVVMVDRSGKVIKEQKLEPNTKEVDLDVSNVEPGVYGVHVYFEGNEMNGILINIASIK